jgi:tRNA (cmo5U34)-methyltransferase
MRQGIIKREGSKQVMQALGPFLTCFGSAGVKPKMGYDKSMTENGQHEAMEAFFNTRACGYDAHMHATLADAESYYRKLAEPLPATSAPIDVLDLGCGTGLEIPAVLIKAPQAQLTCLDLSPEMLKVLKEKFPEGNISIVQGSYITHDFGEARYEMILSSMTLHHLLPEQKRGLYRKCFHALKRWGIYIEGDYIVVEEKMQRLLEAYRALPEAGRGGSHHIDIPLSLKVQVDLLNAAGFRQVRKVYQQGENVILSARKR